MFCSMRDQKGHANPHFRIEQHNLMIIVFVSIQVKFNSRAPVFTSYQFGNSIFSSQMATP